MNNAPATENEIATLRAIATSEYQHGNTREDVVGTYVYAFSIHVAGSSKEAINATLGSLERKGLVRLADDGSDETVAMTEAGADAINV